MDTCHRDFTSGHVPPLVENSLWAGHSSTLILQYRSPTVTRTTCYPHGGTRRYSCYVKITSLTLIQRHNYVVYPVDHNRRDVESTRSGIRPIPPYCKIKGGSII